MPVLSLAGHSGSGWPVNTFTHLGRALRRTFSSRLAPKSAQSAQPKKLQVIYFEGWLKLGHFSDRALPESKYIDPDKLGTKISGIRCATNFTLIIFRWNCWEKSYSRKTRFFRTPKNGFFANKTHAAPKQLFSMRLRPMHNLQNFCPIEAFWWKFWVFEGEKVQVFLVYTYNPGNKLYLGTEAP